MIRKIFADSVAERSVGSGFFVNAEIVFDDSVIDRVPVAERCQFAVGIVFADDPEYTGEKGFGVVRNAGDDPVGEAVKVGGHAVEHGSPAFLDMSFS